VFLKRLKLPYGITSILIWNKVKSDAAT
jgi:hypothetical protein